MTKFATTRHVYSISQELEKILVPRYFNAQCKPLNLEVSVIELESDIAEEFFMKFLRIVERGYYKLVPYSNAKSLQYFVDLLLLFEIFGYSNYSLELWPHFISNINNLSDFFYFLNYFALNGTLVEKLIHPYLDFINYHLYHRFIIINNLVSSHTVNQTDVSKGMFRLCKLFLNENKLLAKAISISILRTLPSVQDFLVDCFEADNEDLSIFNEKNYTYIKWNITCKTLLKQGVSYSKIITTDDGAKWQCMAEFDSRKKSLVISLRAVKILSLDQTQVYVVYVRDSTAKNKYKLAFKKIVIDPDQPESNCFVLKKISVSVRKVATNTFHLRFYIGSDNMLSHLYSAIKINKHNLIDNNEQEINLNLGEKISLGSLTIHGTPGKGNNINNSPLKLNDFVFYENKYLTQAISLNFMTDFVTPTTLNQFSMLSTNSCLEKLNSIKILYQKCLLKVENQSYLATKIKFSTCFFLKKKNANQNNSTSLFQQIQQKKQLK